MSPVYAKPRPHGTVTVTVTPADRSVCYDWRRNGSRLVQERPARHPRWLAFKIGLGLRRDGYYRVRTP